MRSALTTMTLSLNTKSFLRESLFGIYTGLVRSGVKLIPGINEKNYVKALTHVIQECPKNKSGVAMLQQMNQYYNMANMSLSQLANGRRINWLNVKH